MKNSAAKKLKQVLADYPVIGVDPHKKKHAAVFIDGTGKNKTETPASSGRQNGKEDFKAHSIKRNRETHRQDNYLRDRLSFTQASGATVTHRDIFTFAITNDVSLSAATSFLLASSLF